MGLRWRRIRTRKANTLGRSGHLEGAETGVSPEQVCTEGTPQRRPRASARGPGRWEALVQYFGSAPVVS